MKLIDFLNSSLITEAIKLSSGQEVIDAIKNKTVGVKIQDGYKQMNGNVESFVRRDFDKFFSKCNELGIKNSVYGAQFLLGHCNDISLDIAINHPALYIYLKCKTKPWVKEVPEFNQFEKNDFDKYDWDEFEKIMNEESKKHGTATKGSGAKVSGIEKYNDGSWSLEVPNSWEEAKAASFYVEGGKKVPTHWCTRAKEMYYNHYTNKGKNHLYIIKNLKTGRSYQLAFMGDSVEFLDDQDEDGDEITGGDLRAIPDNLLKLVKDENEKNGRTLLDFKNALNSYKSTSKNKLAPNDAYYPGNGIKPKFSKPIKTWGKIVMCYVTNAAAGYPRHLSGFFKVKRNHSVVTEEYENGDMGVNKKFLRAFYHLDYPDTIITMDPKTGECSEKNGSNAPAEIIDELWEKSDIVSSEGFSKRRAREKNKEEEQRKIRDGGNGFNSINIVGDEISKHLGTKVYDVYSNVNSMANRQISVSPLPTFISIKTEDSRYFVKFYKISKVTSGEKGVEDNGSEYETEVTELDSDMTLGKSDYVGITENDTDEKMYEAGSKEFKFWYNISKKIGRAIIKNPKFKAYENYIKQVRDRASETMRKHGVKDSRVPTPLFNY